MKNINQFIEEAAKKRCPEGQYWCYTDKKCKKIPKGWHVMRSGYLARDYEEKKKNGNGNGSNNGNGNGNGHSGNGNGGNGNGSNGGNGGGVSESTYLPRKTGNIITVYLSWRGSSYNIQMFFPYVKTPSRREVKDQVQKVYPGARLWNYQVSDYDPGEPLLQTGGRK